MSYMSRYARPTSPPMSSAASTIGPQMQSLKIVTRLAIEGRAKEGEGVPIKMYLKLALPVENIIPGSAIPLFKEGDVKILDSEVHPLDHNSTPYHFSSDNSPLLHNAARALNLPARLPHSYTHAFESKLGSSSRYGHSSNSNAESERLDDKYTGQIVVSGFNVCFAVPRELPPRSRLVNGDHTTPTAKESRARRSSFGAEKNVVQFMAGISLFVSYTSKPPRAPWLVCIPTPRCLSNSLKLSIFSPPSTNNVSSSYQSLSSAETDSDIPSWDMMVDPHVTRTASARRTAYSYQHFADDESSDSGASPGFSDGVGIQGSFPSTEVVYVRWAVPRRNVDEGVTDGRRRVGVESVSGEVICTVLGRQREAQAGNREGVVMKVEYKGACNGVFYPGVAALLGLDVGLEAKGCDVSWAPDESAEWKVTGGAGYTGHSISGAAESSERSRFPSFDMPNLSLPDDNTPTAGPSRGLLSRYSSSSSTASLLRTALPADNVQDYSFENAPSTPGSEAGMSSVLSNTDGESRGRSRTSSLGATPETSPTMPITVHLNMNELLTSPLTLNISGVVLITPRSPPNFNAEQAMELEVPLPRFSVLAAEAEKISTTVRNGLHERGLSLLVSPSMSKHAKSAELARDARSRLGAEGGRAILRIPRDVRTLSPMPRQDAADYMGSSVIRVPSPLPNTNSKSPARSRVPSGTPMRDASLFASVRPRRGDAPLMIPFVNTIVTPHALGSYAVTLRFPAPAEPKSDWLSFYLLAPVGGSVAPSVSLVSTSVEGVPVLAEIKTATGPDAVEGKDLAFEQLSSADWATLVRVNIGDLGGCAVEVVYIVEENVKNKGKSKVNTCDILLPGFDVPIGRMQVDTSTPVQAIHTNLAHDQAVPDGRRLLHYRLPEHFLPILQLVWTDTPPRRRRWAVLSTAGLVLRCLWWLSAIVPLILMFAQQNDLTRTRAALQSCKYGQGSYYVSANTEPAVVTVTATVLSAPWTSPSPTVAYPSPAEDSEDMVLELEPEPEPAPAPSPTLRMIDVSSATQSPHRRSSHDKKSALLPPQYMYEAWPFGIEFDYHLAMERAVEGLNTVWQFLWRIYNYPMDPP